MLANEIEEIVINARSLAAHRASGGQLSRNPLLHGTGTELAAHLNAHSVWHKFKKNGGAHAGT